jgi:hypothetical protein
MDFFVVGAFVCAWMIWTTSHDGSEIYIFVSITRLFLYPEHIGRVVDLIIRMSEMNSHCLMSQNVQGWFYLVINGRRSHFHYVLLRADKSQIVLRGHWSTRSILRSSLIPEWSRLGRLLSLVLVMFVQWYNACLQQHLARSNGSSVKKEPSTNILATTNTVTRPYFLHSV